MTSDLLRLVTLQDSATRIVLLGTVLLGVACGVVGTFALLRRRALVGDAVAHAALPGVALAFLIVGDRSFPVLLAGAAATGLLAAATISAVRTWTRIRDDAITAIVIGGFFGVGTVLSRLAQTRGGGDRAGLDTFIFGKAATMSRTDSLTIAAVTASVLIATSMLAKELKLLCFDEDFAGAQGWPTRALDLLLMGLICLCVVVALPAVGVILAVALLVIPPAAARFWSDRLGVVTTLAAVFGAASGIIGTAFSAVVPTPAFASMRGWPTGPIITLTASGFFVVSLLAAPSRGIIPSRLRAVGVRRRIGVDHLLRAAYESLESRGDLLAPIDRASIERARRWRAGELELALRRSRRLGLLHPAELRLTDRGATLADAAATRHRLWEHYLVQRAGIAPDHVDRDADAVEHLLSDDQMRRLHDRLRTGSGDPPIPSAHPLPPPSEPGRERGDR